MSLKERIPLYAKIEKVRKRPLIVYVTSSRENINGLMAADAIPELMDQLECLPTEAKAADILVVSNGGDPIVAWRAITLLRERVAHIGVLIPQAAYSAATLLALGANEIVMHPNGHLGPVDPQITVKKPGEAEPRRFGFEEMASYLQFAKEKVGITDEKLLHGLFTLLSQELGTVHVGFAARASLLSLSMGEKLLRLHMTEETDAERARQIAESLNKAFYHHGYPLGRTEAISIGLPIAARDAEIEGLIWEVWRDLESELQTRKPFNPLFELMATDDGARILGGSVAQAKYPLGAPPIQIVTQQPNILKVFDPVQEVRAVNFEAISAVMESGRLASRYLMKCAILGARNIDLSIRLALMPKSGRWEQVALPTHTART